MEAQMKIQHIMAINKKLTYEGLVEIRKQILEEIISEMPSVPITPEILLLAEHRLTNYLRYQAFSATDEVDLKKIEIPEMPLTERIKPEYASKKS